MLLVKAKWIFAKRKNGGSKERRPKKEELKKVMTKNDETNQEPISSRQLYTNSFLILILTLKLQIM